jgi:peptidoglycan/xylan/chitin deacetylase (PgdA/CDA1 family)
MEHGLPVLAALRLPATLFAVSGYCGKSNGWPGQPPWAPRLRLMDWSGLRAAAEAGIEIGAHTVTHPHFRGLPESDIEREMRDAKDELEQRLGLPVTAFAYPYGEATAAAREAAARIFRCACGTRLGFVRAGSDRFHLPRIDVYYLRRRFWFDRLLTRAGSGYLSLRAVLRGIRGGIRG